MVGAVTVFVVALLAPATALALVSTSGTRAASVIGTLADESAPGVALPASPTTGTLDADADSSDLFQVPLSYNMRYSFGLTGDPGTDFDMWLIPPNPATPLSLLDYSWGSDTSTESISYVSPYSSGMGYLRVLTWNTSGSYTLAHEATRVPAPILTASGPSSVAWGATGTITGRATYTDASGTVQPDTGARVLVQRYSGGTWVPVNLDTIKGLPKTVVGSTGSFSVTVKPSVITKYRIRVLPNKRVSDPYETGTRMYGRDSGSTVGWSGYRYVTFGPRVKLSRPIAPDSARRYTSFTIKGYLYPRHAAGVRTVKLTLTRGTKTIVLTPKNENYYSATRGRCTRYVTSVKLPTRGTWKIVASTAASSKYAATKSTAEYITIK